LISAFRINLCQGKLFMGYAADNITFKRLGFISLQNWKKAVTNG